MATIAKTLSLNKNTVYSFLKLYLQAGFKGICHPAVRPKLTRLTIGQELRFKQTIIAKAPFECGLEGNLWTGKVMRQFIKREFAVDYQSGIYDLLDRLDLAHQKAHSDYQNADKHGQVRFIADFKQVLCAIRLNT